MQCEIRQDVANSELINEIFYGLDALDRLGSNAIDGSYIYVDSNGGWLTIGISPKNTTDQAIAVRFPTNSHSVSGCFYSGTRKLFRRIADQTLMIESIESSLYSELPALSIRSIHYAPFFSYQISLVALPWQIKRENITTIDRPTYLDLRIMRNNKITVTGKYHDDLRLAREYDVDLPNSGKMPKKDDLYQAIDQHNQSIDASTVPTQTVVDDQPAIDPIDASTVPTQTVVDDQDDQIELARAALLKSWQPATVDAPIVASTLTKARLVTKPILAIVPPLTEPVSQVDAPIVASDPGTELDSYQSLFKTWKDRNTATKAAKSSSKPKNAKDQIVGIDIGRQCSELLEKYTALEASQITGKSPEYVNRAAGAYWVYLNCIQVKDLIDSGKSTWGILYKASCANPEKKKLSITAKVIERS